MTTVFSVEILGYVYMIYVMCKNYMLSLLSAILDLYNRVESSKITNYFELF